MYILKVVYSTKQNNIFSTVDILAFGKCPRSLTDNSRSFVCGWLGYEPVYDAFSFARNVTMYKVMRLYACSFLYSLKSKSWHEFF